MSGRNYTDAELAALDGLIADSSNSYGDIASKFLAEFPDRATKPASIERYAQRRRAEYDGARRKKQRAIPDGPPPAPRAAPSDAGLFEALAGLTARRPQPVEALADALDMSPRRVRELIERAQAAGYRIAVDVAGQVARPPAPAADPSAPIAIDMPPAPAGATRTIAGVGDIHFASKYHMGAQFADFCALAYARGCRHFFCPGDMLDGVYKHSQFEQTAAGFDAQCDVAVASLPAMPGAMWWLIAGNHDETFEASSGIDVGKVIEGHFRAAGRTDIHFVGARSGYLRLAGPGERGLFVEMWHPGKGGAYAKSYKLQKKVEGYAPGQKPDLLLVGHYHQSIYLPLRGVQCLQVGCWQGGKSSFAKSLGIAPDIGSWIIEYALTDAGAVRRFAPEWIGYQEVESVREVALG